MMTVPVDIYENDVDFTALALQYPEFAKRLKPNGQLDFSDPESVRQLTKALLHRDFSLTIDLPEDRLCPPVPNRFNYVNFVQTLVDTTRSDYQHGHDPSNRILALDIGTGASAIYPLLICRQRSNWFCLTTEIDSCSRQYALRNIKVNELESNIRLIDTDPSGQTILPTSQFQHLDNYAIKIMLTNPPFYSSEAELLSSAKQKSRPPNSACTGAPIEMITPGGEVQFVSRIIHESMQPLNRLKIQWFSSMLGKYSSLRNLITLLKQVNCTNYAVTEFIQGQKTRRWCIAWSWCGLRPPISVARGIPSLEKKLLPSPSEHSFDVPGPSNPSQTTQRLTSELSKLNLPWKPTRTPPGAIAISPEGDVWSRRARRKRPQPPQPPNPTANASIDSEMKDTDKSSTPPSSASDTEEEDPPIEPPLAVQISCLNPPSPNPNPNLQTHISIRWLQGHNPILFESFSGWLKRKMCV